jgi:dephospho-CoA kinase
MGKSTAAEWLRRQGVAVADADILAREVVEPGQPALEAIRSAFGPKFMDATGHLRRSEMARLVFADAAALRRLEAILHPRIRQAWRLQAEAWRTAAKSMAVIVIPLLFETEAPSDFDATVCVACSPATQELRLLARGWSLDEIQRRNAAQMPIEKKIALSDRIVWNEGPLAVLYAQLQRIFSIHEQNINPTATKA